MNSSTRDVVSDRLGLWSLYFAGKLYLYFGDHIAFDLPWNLAFFVCLVAAGPGGTRAQRWSRRVLAGSAAVLLLWRDSWLPASAAELPLLRQSAPTAAFAASFLGRALFSGETAALIALLAGVAWAGRRIHLTWVVLAAMTLVGIRQTADANLPGLDGRLEDFHRVEAARRVAFVPAPAGAPEFDVVMLHVCSLSNDDLGVAGLLDDPFWGAFDVVFDEFNTVSAYSGPAGLRLLRALCGQARHEELYRLAPLECSLFGGLRALGYRTYAVNDHDGSFQDFSKSLESYGRLDPPEPVAGLRTALVNFDGSAIFDDGEVLERWWKARLASKEPRAAVYMNIVALHGGAHAPDARGWWRRSREDGYRLRFARFAADVARFESTVARSGRRVVLVVVPEHGAALRGSSMQPPDLRELPLPQITSAPLAIKLIGWPRRVAAPAIRARRPASYLALAHVLSELLRDPRAGSEREALERVVRDAPATRFVSENAGSVVLNDESAYYLRTAAGGWRSLPGDALARAGRVP